DVGIGPIPQGFGIQVWLHVHVPGMDKDAAMKLVDAAHKVCPYSNATRSNVEVTLDVI
ncbi:MAG: OsmC family protein, partial [Caldimonas sp.]